MPVIRPPRSIAIWAMILATGVWPLRAQEKPPEFPPGSDLTKLSLEELANVEVVYAASKHTQKTSEAPSSVSIVTAAESGCTATGRWPTSFRASAASMSRATGTTRTSAFAASAAPATTTRGSSSSWTDASTLNCVANQTVAKGPSPRLVHLL